jgi:hypothetical protein
MKIDFTDRVLDALEDAPPALEGPFVNSFDFLPAIFTTHPFAKKGTMTLVTCGRLA